MNLGKARTDCFKEKASDCLKNKNSFRRNRAESSHALSRKSQWGNVNRRGFWKSLPYTRPTPVNIRGFWSFQKEHTDAQFMGGNWHCYWCETWGSTDEQNGCKTLLLFKLV